MKKIIALALVGMGIVVFCVVVQANTSAWLFNQDPQQQGRGDQNIILAARDCSQLSDCYQRCQCQYDNCNAGCSNDDAQCINGCIEAWKDCTGACQK